MEAVHLEYQKRSLCFSKDGYLTSIIQKVTCEECKRWIVANNFAKAHTPQLHESSFEMTPGECVREISRALAALEAKS